MVGRNSYNRYIDSQTFMDTSFDDCVAQELTWKGFNTKIKYKKSLVQKITNKFPDIKYLKSDIYLKAFREFINRPFLYLVSDNKKQLLKIGQTVNPYNRFAHYHSISIHKPIRFDLFITINFELQNLYEDKLRNYLEFLGYLLPEDNTNCRLKYIKI